MDEEKLHELKNACYRDFGKLVAKYLAEVPKDQQFELLTQLQEISSVWDSCYMDYLKEEL